MSGEQSKSREETDLLEQNTKKVKGGEHASTNDWTMPIDYADIYEDNENEAPVRRSYKETVLGVATHDEHGIGKDGSMSASEEGTGSEGDKDRSLVGDMNLQIIEKKIGGYNCLEIVIPPHAEERLSRPCKQGLIVNLLGRRIGFKALENRLNQMWVQKGVMSIIDLGCDFFLVYLSNQEDYNQALTNGQLIYSN